MAGLRTVFHCSKGGKVLRTKLLVLSVFVLIGTLSAIDAFSADPPSPDSEASRIFRGYQIAPVPLKLRGRNRDLVGLGSYIVNAQAGCNDCHTNPPYAPGGDPYLGQPKKINVEGYLAGGMHFGPDIVSPNITPDEDGLPAGLTFPEYKHLIRTGHDPDDPDEILQVMPWPVFQNMTDRDLMAVYEYLRSIPSIEGGGDDE
jgi:hypothetical protein